MDLPAIVEAYCQAWNVADEGQRRRLLDDSCADDVSYTDPKTDLAGREALLAHIARVQAGRPGSGIARTSGVDLHHGRLRFAWKLADAAGRTVVEGVDFCELAADGRLRRIVGFFGPLA
ncbi:MAG TPA: nuclear transport factor 2 family protein [Burkholderiales bacterium]|jgi:hypothetical protein|nr:nuclear transport factor 2 family protein [Burkholderiales bacterium]